jgi:serine/threonine protein kinase
VKKIAVTKNSKENLELARLFAKEAETMMMVKHKRVVQFIELDIQTLSLVMELMPLGSLLDFCRKNKSVKWKVRHRIMLDICEGMEFLHSGARKDGSVKKEVFHQDLKSGNVLLCAEGGETRAKIADFGMWFTRF